MELFTVWSCHAICLSGAQCFWSGLAWGAPYEVQLVLRSLYMSPLVRGDCCPDWKHRYSAHLVLETGRNLCILWSEGLGLKCLSRMLKRVLEVACNILTCDRQSAWTHVRTGIQATFPVFYNFTCHTVQDDVNLCVCLFNGASYSAAQIMYEV